MVGRGVLALELQRGGDEALEQGVRTVRAALELGVELRAQMEIAARDLHGLHKASVRAGTGDDQTLLLELGAELVVELIAVAVALVDLRRAVAVGAADFRADSLSDVRSPRQ